MQKTNKTTFFFFQLDQRLGQKPLLIAVRHGLTYIIPLILIGAFSTLLSTLPIPIYQDTMTHLFGSHWHAWLKNLTDATMEILSLLMVVSVSYSYARERMENHRQLNPLIVALVSLSTYIAISGLHREGFPIANLGSIGIFTSLLTALGSAILFIKLSNWKLLQIRLLTDGASTSLNQALSSVFPAAITLGIFCGINQFFVTQLETTHLSSFLSSAMVHLFEGIQSPFWSGILFIFLVHLFWFFGVHGSNVLEPVAQAVFVPALSINQGLAAAGKVPTEIFTKNFFDNFILMGGCGTTLCLVLALLFFGKHKNQLRLAKLSSIPVIFNINEIIVFGLPIILNPIYLIPFLCVPIVLTLISYGAISYGLVPHIIQEAEWTTPIFLSGYVATGSLRGSLLQLINMAVGIGIYLPFIRLAERVSETQLKNNLTRVYDLFRHSEEFGSAPVLLSRQDDIGNIARFMTVTLETDLRQDRLQLFYQPQVDYNDNVVGMEALLRWEHPQYGFVYPPLVVALADESGMMDLLGYWIIDSACRDLKKLEQEGFTDITISVNISSVQLEARHFIEDVSRIIQKHGIRPHLLELEITEHLALSSGKKMMEQILALKHLGVKLAMDDFGMGHSSLMYLKEYEFDTVKLDGSLVREIEENSNCRNIVSTIVALGNSLHYSVIAEYVENQAQKDLLQSLGCTLYQGYFYSPPIPYEQMIDYITCMQREKDKNPSMCHPIQVPIAPDSDQKGCS